MTDVTISQQPTILLADDEICVREITAEILQGLGYRILQAADGLEALKLFEQQRDDIVVLLLDVIMPHYNGLEVAERIRYAGSNVPIIFISGYDKWHVLGTNTQPPNSIFLSKPINFNVLIQNVGNHFQDQA
ncbi:MAG: response regulator [Mariprofundus sp.]|nr:response regulator [Mariprofundus sp.]